MEIYVTRESVAAGDDFDPPHTKEFSLDDGISIPEALKVIQKKYLPKIGGGEATWSVFSNVPVAVLAQQWAEPKMILFPPDNMEKLDVRDGVLRLHFNYHAQLDPNLVVTVLSRVHVNAARSQ